MRHVLSALVQNQPGVLAHISGMLASRAFNIDSLAVGETEKPDLSRMTFVVHGDDAELEQVRKQDRKSTRLNSSHTVISYAVFCLKKKSRGTLIVAASAKVPARSCGRSQP